SAERAQILKDLGDVLKERGELTQAEPRYTEASRLWDEVVGSEDNPTNRLNAAEAHLALGTFWDRIGDAARAESAYGDAADRALKVLKATYHEVRDNESDTVFQLGR